MTDGQATAFPLEMKYDETAQGLTKREYFATMAMQGRAMCCPIVSFSDYEQIVEDSVALADALIAALNEK
jgi:hypothetical protein